MKDRMITTNPTDSSRHQPRPDSPGYGPIEAAIGFAVFSTFVNRATPTIVEVFSDAVVDFTPSAVRFGLASVLWFALIMTTIEQIRRHVEPYRVGYGDDGFQQAVSTELWTLGYDVMLLIGGLLAWLTLDRAVESVIAIIRMVVTLDVSSFVVVDFVAMVVFFTTFGVAIRAVDRIIIGGTRSRHST